MFYCFIAPSVKGPDFSSDCTIIISFSRSPFEINKVNSCSVLTASRTLNFLSNLSNTDKV